MSSGKEQGPKPKYLTKENFGMNFMVGIFLVLSVCIIASAADKETPAVKAQSADDYYDGGSIDQQPTVRNPSSGDLPYSDDEIQRNTPENYTPKNMPIDQD
jgi:hypothetical protein